MKHLVIPLIAATNAVLNPSTTYADLGDQLFKLLADDGAEADTLGESFAITYTVAIVRSAGNDDNRNYPGFAYLVDAIRILWAMTPKRQKG